MYPIICDSFGRFEWPRGAYGPKNDEKICSLPADETILKHFAKRATTKM